MKYKQKTYKKIKWIPLSVIRKSFENNWERSLNLFILLKQLHKKPIIYNFTYKSLSEQLEVSKGYLHKHITKLKEEGLISISNGHLKLLSTDELKYTFGSTLVPVRTSKNKATQLTLLKYCLIKRNLHLQYKVNNLRNENIDIYTGAKTNIKKSYYKSFKKKVDKVLSNPKYKHPESYKNDYFILSNSKFGLLIGKGKTTGHKLQKELNRLKLIKSERNVIKQTHSPINKAYFKAIVLGNKYFLSNRGLIYLSLPNRITI